MLVVLLRLDHSTVVVLIKSNTRLTGDHGLGSSAISLLLPGGGSLLDWIVIHNTITGADTTLLVGCCGVFDQIINLSREISLKV